MSALLRSVWDEPRPARVVARTWWDWALVAVLVPVAVLEGVLGADPVSPVGSIILVAGLVPTLLWRRDRPLLMVVLAFGISALAKVMMGGEPGLNTMAYMLLLPYSLFRWGSGRAAVLGLPVMLGNVGLSVLLGYLSVGNGIGGCGIIVAACAVGAAVRYRGRARTRELEQVKLLERERLARDLHDTVAHHVSAMAIRAQAGLATAATRPEAATEALSVIEAEASRALAEMRTMVRALRHNEPVELAPNPRIGDLEWLANSAQPGPEVAVEIVGTVDDLPESVGSAIFRLAQESVTNARRHARHATRIEVRVVADDTSVRLRVSDDGVTGPARTATSYGPSNGHGLIGMIERADLLGGTCEAGPNPDRGWTVTAVLPRAGAAR